MREQQGANIFESIPEQSFFDYSLGGYSHRERWSHTQQNCRLQELWSRHWSTLPNTLSKGELHTFAICLVTPIRRA
jgi:hypothetical protein